MSEEPTSKIPEGATMVDKKHFHIEGEKYGSSKKTTKKVPKEVKND